MFPRQSWIPRDRSGQVGPGADEAVLVGVHDGRARWVASSSSADPAAATREPTSTMR
jgi:hypothetical protein